MQQADYCSLWGRLHEAERRLDGFLTCANASVPLAEVVRGSCLEGPAEDLAGRSVLIATKDQLPSALAIIELDGIARQIVIAPPDLSREQVTAMLAAHPVDAIVTDEPTADWNELGIKRSLTCHPVLARTDRISREGRQTEWVLLTSGTTGVPKLVSHTLSSLTGAIKQEAASPNVIVWSTFYDIRRYGGLQIFLRAVISGSSLVLTSASEPLGGFLSRAASSGVTHISGTPSQWRRVLMSPKAHEISPAYIRLSGEIVDQAILDKLQALYPQARIVHAFASTEAGVAFDVTDGLEGFPASLIATGTNVVEMKVEDGSLRIRSKRTASRYLGRLDGAIQNEDGFVDTRDMVELRGDRYYFVGRRDGVINVGGLKVHPEEVEAVINRHHMVRMSLVRTRKSPITGAVVIADIVLEEEPYSEVKRDTLQAEILRYCGDFLPRHKVPVATRFVSDLPVGQTGKIVR